MSQRKEIFKEAGRFAFSSQLTQFITLIAAVLSRRFLGPTQVGIWSTLQIIVEYSKYSAMGSLYSVAKEIPYLLGKGETKIAEQVKNIVFTVTLAGSGLVSLGILVFALVSRGWLTAELTFGLIFVSAIIILQRFNDLLISLLRCYKRFTLAAKQMLWSAAVNALLVAVLAYRFKIYGFIWAIGLSFVFNILYIHIQSRFHFRFEFDRKRFRELIAFGFPMMIIGIMTTIIRSVDRIMIAKMLGFEALGFYSIAFMASVYIQSSFNAVAIVLFPHLQERFSVKDDPKDLKGLVYRSAHLYLLAMPAIIGAAWIIGPYFISLLLPKFISGIEAMKMLSITMLFLSLAQPFNDFLITIKRHLLLLPLLGLTALVSFLFNYWAIRAEFGITGVASATSFAAFFNFSMIYFFAARYLVDSKDTLMNYLVFLGSAAYLLCSLLFVNHLIPTDFRSLRGALMQAFVFAVFYGVLIFFLIRRFELISFLRLQMSGKSDLSPATLDTDEL